MAKDKETPFSMLRGTKKQRVLKKLKEIRDKYATRFRKKPPVPGMRTSQWETVNEPKEKLYGGLKVVNDGDKTFIIYQILKGWKYRYGPDDYDEKGNPKKGAVPISKDPIVEEKIEEVK